MGACECRRELEEVHSGRAEEIAEIEARADICRRHPSVAHLARGLRWLLCLIALCNIRTENMGIIDVFWRGQEGCLLDLIKKMQVCR